MKAMILEGIVTTLNEDSSVNISPMGPYVDRTMDQLILRLYPTSHTFQNLKRTRQGVFHVTDDVLLFARAAIGRFQELPPTRPATAVKGEILTESCRWYAFGVEALDEREARRRLVCPVVDRGHQRNFWGFNRAKHAVLEAAILATRLQFIARDEIRAEFDRLAVIVEKTGGEQEEAAFRLLLEYVDEASPD